MNVLSYSTLAGVEGEGWVPTKLVQPHCNCAPVLRQVPLVFVWFVLFTILIFFVYRVV